MLTFFNTLLRYIHKCVCACVCACVCVCVCDTAIKGFYFIRYFGRIKPR